MATLHTVNKSPFEKNSLERCLSTAKDGSTILFIEDGVYSAVKGTKVSSSIEAALGKHNVYALKPDVTTRGLSDNMIDGIELVDYDGFVDLAAECSKVQSWL